MSRIFVLAGILLAASACSHHPAAFSGPRPVSELSRFQHCDDESECIRVDNGCCNCANGGATTSINRKFEDEFRAAFDCRGVICTQKAGACLFREPLCQDHLCVLGHRPQRFPVK